MDIPLAVLSDHTQLLYDYFQQNFAQVTNPPMDGVRESIVTSASTIVGNVANIMIGTYRYINHTTGEYLWLFTEGHLVTLADGEKRIYFNYTNVSSLKQAQEAEESMSGSSFSSL